MTLPSVFRFSFQRLALLLSTTLSATLMLGSAGVDLFELPIRGRAANAVRSDRAVAQVPPSQPLTLRANSTVANAKTGVVVARGNVQINYPSRQIQATAAQAVFFSRENRIVLTGNVYVLQQGNSLRGETITYLVNEGRFEALPDSNKQVEAIYLVKDAPVPTSAPAIAAPTPAPPVAAPFNAKPEFSAPAPNKR